MAAELTTPRAINQACQMYATGGSGHPVYCTKDGYNGNIRVIRAKTVKKVLRVRSIHGEWVIPNMVFTV